ncbi:diguanylate cyclase [Blastococcus sp. KM273128]|uniref:histidine kinase N-terminal 7TM domain-containing diguanylate cyclase n=1 Tax=Blastococcus sp. KM273128 TaxID=2570314 RepID=UPI001EFFA480|nr:diguanylate cyclase [Blastococcus sp. KM273128]MCF6743629.1 diguanylate cyclase [Blastococcus sp. KM273128]
MSPQQWALLFASAAVVALVTAGLAWQRRERTPAATALAATMAGAAGWSAVDAVLHGLASDAVRMLYPPLLLAAVGVIVAGIHTLSRAVADPSWRPTRRRFTLLAVEPVLLVVAASLPATRELVIVGHGATGSDPFESITLGPLFEAHTVYSYVLIAEAYWHLGRRWRNATGIFRRQIGVLLGAGVISTAGNATALALQTAGQVVDVTPLFFVVTGLINCWALLRLGLLRLVPVARDQVVDTVPDAVLVVDPAGILIDLNPAAGRLLARLRTHLRGQELVGRPLADIAGQHAVAVLDRTERLDGHRVAEVRRGLWLDVRDAAVSDSRGRALGRIVVVRDVSEQQARQAAVEQLNSRLEEQVREIERLRAELAEEAVRDPLTGLHNRRQLDRALAADRRVGAVDGELSVVVVDIDHFKAVNDRFGHAAGDDVLRAVAGVLRRTARDGDTVARMGGEEFVLVLPGVPLERAVERAEQIRRSCALLRHEVDGEMVSVSVSAGVATGPAGGVASDRLLEAADRALYTAKASGRDRVVAAPGRRVALPSPTPVRSQELVHGR